MKTRLLKRMRREAETKFPVIQMQMRDHGFGENLYEIYNFLPVRTDDLIEAQQIAERVRRKYIVRRVAELKRKRK